jgi:glycosyltransferase involved in cell wall biosynthesis
VRIGLLTGADDRSYALGLAASLVERGICLDFIGSDQIDGPELHGTPFVRFLNLRGDQSTNVSVSRKVGRLLAYYLRLMAYAVTARPKVFHILWNNKFEYFDRTLLMLYYRLLGRRVVLTAHNVNAAKRDGSDSLLNRLTLRVQYRLCDHIFVHTHRMRDELRSDFGILLERISVIPFGINNTTPTTAMDGANARQRLGLGAQDRVILFFGQIAPYKGLEYLVAALPNALAADPALRVVIAGKVKVGCEDYWSRILSDLGATGLHERVVMRIEHIPDEDVEIYFKAADALVIPYVHIFQSGVPFLAYSFGLPVIATDVGALRDDIVEGRTGLICRPRDPADLNRAFQDFFHSSLYRDLHRARDEIKAFANDRHSWSRVAAISEMAYRRTVSAA